MFDRFEHRRGIGSTFRWPIVSSWKLPVRVKKTLRLIEDDLAELGIERLSNYIEGTDLWLAISKFGKETLGAWSIGEFHEMPGTTSVRKLRPVAK